MGVWDVLIRIEILGGETKIVYVKMLRINWLDSMKRIFIYIYVCLITFSSWRKFQYCYEGSNDDRRNFISYVGKIGR